MAEVPSELTRLVDEFEANEIKYKAKEYKEQWAREQFIDPLLRVLGWQRGSVTDPAWDGYISEDRVTTIATTRAPDYGCYYSGRRAFFVEAKAPSVRVGLSKPDAFQVRSYGWSAGVPLAVLTDFEEVAVYDCRTQPSIGDEASVARIRYFRYNEWSQHWTWFSELFSRAAVEAGSLVVWASENKADEPSIPVSRSFLRSVEKWRAQLATAIIERNPTLSAWELTESTQLLLDRLIFLRITEARGIEADRTLLGSVEHGEVYKRLLALFGRAENRFNSSLFHFTVENGRPGQPDTLTPRLGIEDDVLRSIVREFYPPLSPYEFAAIPAEILGEVYEQFLGSQIILTAAGGVDVEIKPEIKDAGGVVYTPADVVHYMFSRALLPLLDGASVAKVQGSAAKAHPLRILDPACGSGSFLIQAYEFLLRWYLEQYEADPTKWSKGRTPRIAPRGGGWALTIAERKRILLDHIYGVDVDHQAVEVTKLSLMLKALEGEDATTLGQQLQLIHERALPDLSGNIRCGNTLVEPNFMDLDASLLSDVGRSRQINPFRFADEFPAVYAETSPGFDLVIGNPPYVLLEDAHRDDLLARYYGLNFTVAAYKLDLYHFFIERCLELANGTGVVSLIVPSNFMTNNHLGTLRTLMVESGLREISVVDSAVFARRSVDTAIFVCAKGRRPPAEIATRRLLRKATGLAERGDAVIRADSVAKSPERLLIPASTGVDALLSQMEASAVTDLGSIAYVNFGKQLRDRKIHTGDVIRVDREEDIEPPYKACYTGENVGRYKVEWNGLACLDDPVAQRGGTWERSRQDGVDKLLTKQIGKWPEWAIDTVGRQCLNTVFMVNVHDPSYPAHALLALLNSATVRAYWVGRYWDQRRTFPKIKGTYLKRIPLPALDAEVAKRLDDDGRQLVTLHASDDSTNQRLRLELMKRVEGVVAGLYGLDATSHAQLIDLLRSDKAR